MRVQAAPAFAVLGQRKRPSGTGVGFEVLREYLPWRHAQVARNAVHIGQGDVDAFSPATLAGLLAHESGDVHGVPPGEYYALSSLLVSPHAQHPRVIGYA